MFRCAFFESDITPPLYHNMPGYFSERLAEDVLDKLYAKAFVCCGSNGVKTAMVAIDANMIPEEIVVAAKKRIADWEKKGEFPEPLRTQSHTPKARIAALIWVIIIVMGILFNIGFSMFR